MGGGAVVVVGGTSGLGRAIAEAYAARGRDVVITGRSADRCRDVAAAIEGPGDVSFRAFDLAEPDGIRGVLGDVGEIDHLVLAAIERDLNTVQDYDVGRAVRLVTLKLVGYTAVVHALAPRLGTDGS